MDAIELMRKLGFALVQGADRIAMGEARLSRLALETGVSIELPERPIKEVDDPMRAYILAARGPLSETEWLRQNGPRDQICVRFGLTREQIAGVLAAATRRENGVRVAEVESSPKEDCTKPLQGPVEPVAITHEPDTWPKREALHPDNDIPPRNKKEYEVDETDFEILLAVLAHNKSDYDALRLTIARVRRLTTQQVAWLRARYTREN